MSDPYSIFKNVSCPKCAHDIVFGPSYRGPGEYIPPGFTAPLPIECLVYTCGRCGYTYSTPTNDNFQMATSPQGEKEGADK